jgi:hypothetical protein
LLQYRTLGYFLSPVSRFPVMLQHAIPYCERLPVGPITFVYGAAISDIFLFLMLTSR